MLGRARNAGSAAIVLILAGAVMVPPAMAQKRSVRRAANVVARTVTAPKTVQPVTKVGSVKMSALPAAGATAKGKDKQAGPLQAKKARSLHAAAAANPTPSSLPLTTAPGSPLGFVGITAATNNAANAFDLEPPDQGLCAHGQTVMEPVNLTMGIYQENGIILQQPVALNAFFGQAPAVSSNGSTTTYGPFLSDPRCYYDAQTQRWFVTILEIDTNPTTGALANRSHELIAVSQSSDPTGAYTIFSIDTTNDGTNGTSTEANCPCFGDQPRIGADANGFYISTDSYPITANANSNGGELYAISKTGLVAAATGGSPPPVVAIHIGAVTVGGYPANAVQPAETPQGAAYASNREYFLSTPDFNGFTNAGGAGASSLVLWTLLNTSTLGSTPSSVTLTDAIVPTEAFTPPVNAAQKAGPFPLGQALKAALPPISVNDDRMQQVQYLGGSVYGALNTAVGSGSSARSGIAWFQLATSSSSGSVSHQGYLATGNGASLMYPAIGLNPGGKGTMTFSVSGPQTYPSAAYVPFNHGPTGSVIDVTGPGTAPEDGFSCYSAFGGGPACRWGDYSAATADGSGHIVMGDEMIPNVARTQLANWGTYVSSVTP